MGVEAFKVQVSQIGWVSTISSPFGQKSVCLDGKSTKLDDPSNQLSLKMKS